MANPDEAVPALIHFPQQPWNPIYGAFASTISSIRARYHAGRHAAAIAAAAAAELAAVPKRFVVDIDSGDDDASSIHSVTSATSVSVNSDASISAFLTALSTRVWDTKVMRPKQTLSVRTIYFGEDCGGKLIVIDRTSGGKSHILRMVGTLGGGIVLVTVPLLSLTADQMKKIKEAGLQDASVEGHNIDDISSTSLRECTIPRMHEIDGESSSTMFLFTSPQELLNNLPFCDAILQCHRHQTLRLLAIDELHLYAQHGSTFQEEIRRLTAPIFNVIFSDDDGSRVIPPTVSWNDVHHDQNNYQMQ